MFTLYYAPGTCSLASHLALEHAGIAYNAIKVDFAAGEQRSAHYLQVNPKGRVPALVTERGILTETPALLLYIAQASSVAGLAPMSDPFALGQMNAFNSYLSSTVHVAHAHKRRGARWADDPAALQAMREKVPRSVGDAFSLIEDGLLQGRYVLGDKLSVSDYYLLTLSRWLESDGVDLGRLPRVLAHRKRMLELDLVQRIISQEESVDA